MSRFFATFYGRFIQPNKSIIISVIVVSLLIAIAVMFMKNMKTEISPTRPLNEIMNKPTGGKMTIYMFHVDWCPHCKKAMPDWKTFVNEYNGQKVNEYDIKCIDIDCTDDSVPDIKQALEKYNVDSFPTVKGVYEPKHGKTQTITFDAKINVKNLEKFVQSTTLTVK